MQPAVSNSQRFSRNNPCPICGGCQEDRRGTGTRCGGFFKSDGDVVCTRVSGGALYELDDDMGWVHAAPDDYAPKRPRQSPPQKPKRAYPSIKTVITRLQCKFSEEYGSAYRCTRQDYYQDADGKNVMVVLRFDSKDGRKEYRPLHKTPAGWVFGDPPPPLPLFNLPALLKDRTSTVIVVEGEKTACELIELGFLATTSAHGAKSPRRTDWTPLMQRNVYVWRDKDESGSNYDATVKEILR